MHKLNLIKYKEKKLSRFLLISKRKINIFNHLFILSAFLHKLTYFFETSQHKNINTFPVYDFQSVKAENLPKLESFSDFDHHSLRK